MKWKARRLLREKRDSRDPADTKCRGGSAFARGNEFKLGSLWDGSTKPEIQAQFKESNCYSKPECQDCWAKLYCSGGCPANALHATGSLNGTYGFSCDIFKKRIECSMMVKVVESFREMEEKELVGVE